MKRVLSGMQPSGQLTLGNYIGALRNYVKMQEQYDCYFMVVDHHAITVPQDPAALREQTESAVALYLAAGLDADKACVFLQSHVPAHVELGWILTTITYMGELERMTQFKDKSAGKETVGAGLFTYPSLMAADILLYNADLIPVGEDQKQHLELTRDLAARFNNRFGETFRMPDPYIPEVGGRIMSLDDASKKMSKSNPNKNSFITMLDEPSVIRKKISRAVTDSGREVRFDPVQKSEISNLMSIYTHCSDLTLADLEAKYEGQGYGAFKKDLAEAVVSTFEPIQQRYREIRESGYIFDVLKKGAEKASETAELTLNEVKEKMGYILPL
ncbi:tryptophan--tRNA ligase [Paenibacillus larvae]|nr:tryptophan--tRNA ligase [Paenibacillus larvae]AQR77839.1 tryptophan--tRNA ligase [Paenibacillus larvae subsp. larvae]AQT84274.1 tryptophan--tRNA ligase [Paenibacillus larvae subsp. pulvifaciens]AQZ46251.1 tryptophan--tRNA ligase [Paenibacillus larvae subsp. pulvifaciens]ARF67582.1 tryptophan--tRNA ligase [Paenibacillus larvae subsp. pulvifaciens]AVF21052.1 tryptophan--tRNA ligase TrpS [Paenibacillus larvae subsp. larvae]